MSDHLHFFLKFFSIRKKMRRRIPTKLKNLTELFSNQNKTFKQLN